MNRIVIMQCQRCNSKNLRKVEPESRTQVYRGMKPGGKPGNRGQTRHYICKECECEFTVLFDPDGTPSQCNIIREGRTREAEMDDFFYAKDEGR